MAKKSASRKVSRRVLEVRQPLGVEKVKVTVEQKVQLLGKPKAEHSEKWFGSIPDKPCVRLLKSRFFYTDKEPIRLTLERRHVILIISVLEPDFVKATWRNRWRSPESWDKALGKFKDFMDKCGLSVAGLGDEQADCITPDFRCDVRVASDLYDKGDYAAALLILREGNFLPGLNIKKKSTLPKAVKKFLLFWQEKTRRMSEHSADKILDDANASEELKRMAKELKFNLTLWDDSEDLEN